MAPSVGPRLVVAAGPAAGRVYALRQGSQLIGRANDADVVIPSDDVSRKHAYIRWDGTTGTVEDAGSRNGTAVNGDVLSGSRALRSGDVLRVGSVELRFEVGPSSVGQAPDPSPAPAGFLDFREEWSAGSSPSPLPSGESARPAARIPESKVAVDRHDGGRDSGVGGPGGLRHDPPGATGENRIPSSARGIARSVNIRFDQRYEREMLTFHLDRYDSSGNRLPPVGVAMSSYRQGQLTDGDEVEVKGRIKRGTLVAERIVNLTTGSEVIGGTSRWAKAVGIVTLILILAAMAAFFASMFVGDNTIGGGVIVPAVLGQDSGSAFQEVGEAGLFPVTRTEPSQEVPAGQVIDSEPPAGTSVSRGSTVTLIVSGG